MHINRYVSIFLLLDIPCIRAQHYVIKFVDDSRVSTHRVGFPANYSMNKIVNYSPFPFPSPNSNTFF